MSRIAQLVSDRLLTLPDCLRSLLVQCDPAGHSARPAVRPLTAKDAPIWVTGGGMSEGPAHYLVALLSAQGIAATFVPLSEFVSESLPQPGHTLVLFSQGLAPNARFPLRHHASFARTIVVTSVCPDSSANEQSLPHQLAQLTARGIELLVHPPAQESGILLRVVGPMVQALAAAIVAGIPIRALQALPDLYQQQLAQAPQTVLFPHGQLQRLVLLAGGRYGSACFGLRWKLLEGLLLADPPVYDLLQVAHGPLQSLWNQPAVLLLLERHDAPHEETLYARIRQVFSAPHHHIVSLRAQTHPGLLCYFEHAALLDALLLDALRRFDPPLERWPGQHQDGPLYDFAPHML